MQFVRCSALVSLLQDARGLVQALFSHSYNLIIVAIIAGNGGYNTANASVLLEGTRGGMIFMYLTDGSELTSHLSSMTSKRLSLKWLIAAGEVISDVSIRCTCRYISYHYVNKGTDMRESSRFRARKHKRVQLARFTRSRED